MGLQLLRADLASVLRTRRETMPGSVWLCLDCCSSACVRGSQAHRRVTGRGAGSSRQPLASSRSSSAKSGSSWLLP